MTKSHKKNQQGFTLVEMSIVLVIIGLIVGGVLVGQDLVKGAQIRATVAQLQQYDAAINTFRGKYDQFPGDMSAGKNTAFFGAAVILTMFAAHNFDPRLIWDNTTLDENGFPPNVDAKEEGNIESLED